MLGHGGVGLREYAGRHRQQQRECKCSFHRLSSKLEFRPSLARFGPPERLQTSNYIKSIYLIDFLRALVGQFDIRLIPDSLGLRRWCQSPAVLQPPLQRLEDQTVHHVPNGYDEKHYCEDLAHIVQVTAHHEQLTESQADE